MAQTVSNDALWEKLKEMDEKIDVVQTTVTLKGKQTEKSAESAKVEIYTTIFEEIASRMEIAVTKTKESTIVEHQHQHRIDIDIQSNWFFFSWLVLVVVIFGLFWVIADQRETINEYSGNDLKYRYVKMIGQANEDSFTRLDQQFQFNDSIKIIRKQVERYEELVKKQAEKMERTKENHEQNTIIQKEIDRLKNKKFN